MRISDWSSDVCSSDLATAQLAVEREERRAGGFAVVDPEAAAQLRRGDAAVRGFERAAGQHQRAVDAQRVVGGRADRKSVVWGKSLAVRVDLGGRRFLKKKKAVTTIIALHYKIE